MRLADILLPEFDAEMTLTRKTLERVPDDKLAWKPHDKSMSMGALATHLSNIPTWAVLTLTKDNFDMAPAGGPPPKTPELHSRAEILAKFDMNVGAAHDAIAASSDEQLFKPWSLLMTGKVMLTLPRLNCLRSFVLNHTIHHRAQLGVFLRLNNIPVPSIYGPSADESPF